MKNEDVGCFFLVIIFVIMGYYFYMYPYTIITILAIIGLVIAIFNFLLYLDSKELDAKIKKEKEEEREKLEREKLEREKLEREKLEKEKLEKEKLEKEREKLEREKLERKRKEKYSQNIKHLSDLLNIDYLIIDSDIWVDPCMENFFSTLEFLLKKCDKHFTLYTPQFEEICNIRTYWTDSSAIDRIDKFSDLNLLSIKEIDLNIEDNLFSESLIAKLSMIIAYDKKQITVITNDKELRIRIRENLKRIDKCSCNVLGIDNILPKCNFIENYHKNGTI